MPHWGKGVQSWVNNWVNVNNKHIVFPQDEENEAAIIGGGEHAEGNATEPVNEEQNRSQSSLSNSSATVPLHEQRGSSAVGTDGGLVASEGHHTNSYSSRRRQRQQAREHRLPPQPAAVVGDGRAILQRRGGIDDSMHHHPDDPGGGSTSSGRHMHLWGHESASSNSDLRLNKDLSSEKGMLSTVESPSAASDLDLSASNKGGALKRIRKKEAGGGKGEREQFSLATVSTVDSTVVSSTNETRSSPMDAPVVRSSSITSSTPSDGVGGLTGDLGERSVRRINTRRLRRTNSQSDLLKQMAVMRSQEETGVLAHNLSPSRRNVSTGNTSGDVASYHAPQHSDGVDGSKHRSSDASTSASGTVQHANRGRVSEGEEEGARVLSSSSSGGGSKAPQRTSGSALSWVTEFFGGEHGGHHQQRHQQQNADEGGTGPAPAMLAPPFVPPSAAPHLPLPTGQYLNEAAFVQQQQLFRLSANTYPSSQRESIHSSVDSGSSSGRRRRERRRSGAVRETLSSLSASSGLEENGTAPVYHQQQAQQFIRVKVQEQNGDKGSTRIHEVNGLSNNFHRGSALSGRPGRATHCGSGPYGTRSVPASPVTSTQKSKQQASTPSLPPGAQTATDATTSGVHNCPSCEDMERRLLAVQADLDYLRSVALQNEFVCSECENGGSGGTMHSGHSVISSTSSRRRRNKDMLFMSTLSASSVASAGHQESVALKEASLRLVEVTARHKRQIEQMTRERARWQNDMHLKLSKFAMMCKDLNDESAKRKEEAMAAQAELNEVKTERNALATEVRTLRAKVQVFEKEGAENIRLRDMLRSLENETLDRADEAIKKRDKVIVELSDRLERTLDTLEIERQQQRQRRQIIFPVSRPANNLLSLAGDRRNADNDSHTVKTLTEDLAKAREAARIAQSNLDSAKAEAARKERLLRARCDELSRELKAAEQRLSESSCSNALDNDTNR